MSLWWKLINCHIVSLGLVIDIIGTLPLFGVKCHFPQKVEGVISIRVFWRSKVHLTLPYRVGSKWIFWTNHFNLSVLKQSFWFGCFEGAISIWVFWRNHFNFGVLKESFRFECFEGVILIWVFWSSHFDLSVLKESFRFWCFEVVISIWVFQRSKVHLNPFL